MPSFAIRQAGRGDAGAILNCLSSAFEVYRQEYTPDAFLDTVLTEERLEHRFGEMTILVAVAESRIVGTIAYQVQGTEGHLRGMAILPEWQGRGVAAALLQAAESGLRELGCVSATLDTTEPLRRAIRFYERRGFGPSGQIRDFFGMRLHEYAKRL